MQLTGVVIVLALFAGGALAADGEFACDENHTIDSCYNAAWEQSTASLREYANSESIQLRRTLSVATTGDISANVLGTPLSLNDFLSPLNISVGELTSDDGTQLSVQYSPDKEWIRGDWKFGLSTVDASVAEALKSAISDSGLQTDPSTLTVDDDIRVTVEYSYTGRIGPVSFGRRFSDHSLVLSSLAGNALARSERPRSERTRITEITSQMLTVYGNQIPGNQDNISFKDWRNIVRTYLQSRISDRIKQQPAGSEASQAMSVFPDIQASDLAKLHDQCDPMSDRATRQQDLEAYATSLADCFVNALMNLVREDANAELMSLSTFRDGLQDIGYFKVGELIDNQPQLILSLKYIERDDYAGADQFSAKLSLEGPLGGHTMSGLNRELRDNQGCGDWLKEGERAARARIVQTPSESTSRASAPSHNGESRRTWSTRKPTHSGSCCLNPR